MTTASAQALQFTVGKWNILGLQAIRAEFSLLISTLKPHVIVVQETKIGNKHNISL